MQTVDPRATLEFSGRITATSRGRAGFVLPLNISGRITTTSRSRSEFTLPASLTGRIVATSRATSAFTAVILSGRIKASSQGRSEFLTRIVPLQLDPGRIKASSFGRIVYSTELWDGRVQATSRARSDILTLAQPDSVPLIGRVGTYSQARTRRFHLSYVLDTFTANIKTSSASRTGFIPSIVSGAFSGRIRSSSLAYNTTSIIPPPPTTSDLFGAIRTASSGTFVALPTRDLVGTIRTTAQARIAQSSERLGASVLATTGLRSGQLQLRILLEGQIATKSWASLPVTQALLFGTIRTTSYGKIPNLPLLPQAGPIVCPVDVDLSDYINLITSEHINKPRYRQTITNTVQPYVDDQKLVGGLPCLFDVDIAVGEQEDFTGQWIGKTRYVTLGDVFFSWDVEGLGWDEANWRGPFDPPNMLAELDDYHYRLLLYATIVANHWDGSIPSAYTAWDTLFYGTGYQVLIQDYGNMTMMLGLRGSGPIDVVTQALFSNGHMDLKPEGISLIDYVFQAQPDVPFFAFDAHTDAAAGWDIGYWGHLVPPGQGFIPDAEIVEEDMQ